MPASQLSKAISRISTEYRLQFAWPKRAQLTNGEVLHVTAAAGNILPRKSLSMGALKQGTFISCTGPVPVHKKRAGDIHRRDGNPKPSKLKLTHLSKQNLKVKFNCTTEMKM